MQNTIAAAACMLGTSFYPACLRLGTHNSYMAPKTINQILQPACGVSCAPGLRKPSRQFGISSTPLHIFQSSSSPLKNR